MDLSNRADVYNSLNQLHIDLISSSFLVSTVSNVSKVSCKYSLTYKPVIFEM